MVKKTATATAETAYLRKLETPITFEFSWDEYETHDEVVAAKDELSNVEVVKYRNNEHKANARTKALNAALDAAGIVKPTAENDDQVRFNDMVKTLRTAKRPDGEPLYTVEAARTLAATSLGLNLSDME